MTCPDCRREPQDCECEPFDPTTSPGHTDLMVPPETIDAWLADNPLTDLAWPLPEYPPMMDDIEF